jgi:restriction endonuclease Mrr
MEAWTTQASKDDGIDAVIFNNTPITVGLTVVQAKQYTASVGVQHVRELMGARDHKKAGSGGLIPTSSFRGCEGLSARTSSALLGDAACRLFGLLDRVWLRGWTSGGSRGCGRSWRTSPRWCSRACRGRISGPWACGICGV